MTPPIGERIGRRRGRKGFRLREERE